MTLTSLLIKCRLYKYLTDFLVRKTLVKAKKNLLCARLKLPNVRGAFYGDPM